MFEKVSRSLKYDSNIFFDHRHIYIYYYPRAQASRVMYGVRVYIYMSSKKNVIERTRDLIYLKFVATDFFQKIISPSAGENSGDLA